MPDSYDPFLQIDCSPGAICAAGPPPALPDGRRDPAIYLPRILTGTTPAWRRACLAQVARIPAGYTYLAQLMGHDMGNSVGLDAIPHVPAAPGPAPDRRRPAMRYNQIENPLTLETVYGPGPKLLNHLYDPETLLFRITPGARLARVYPGVPGLDGRQRGTPIRALYDERNRDTLMLHELTVAWMQFHNRCARALMAAGKSPFLAYALGRAHAVRVWHLILTVDLLPRFLHPRIATLPADALSPDWELNEPTLLHGLFRAFHALPLAAYPMRGTAAQALGRLMKSGPAPSHAETTDWRIDWPAFLGARAGGPLTGLSASVAPELRMAEAIAAMDFVTATETFPMRLENPALRRASRALPDDWPDRLTPKRLAEDFATAHPDAPGLPGPGVLKRGPLYLALLVEAQLHGQDGGFGPLGSALLRASVLGSMARVRLAGETLATRALPRPATMLDLIDLARKD